MISLSGPKHKWYRHCLKMTWKQSGALALVSKALRKGDSKEQQMQTSL